MPGTTSDDRPTLAEASALFAVTVNGPNAWSEIVRGLQGVRDAVLAAVLRERRDAVARDVEVRIARVEDAAAWVEHGVGDGRPYWHWWLGLSDGSVSVQRITAPFPTDPERIAEEAERRARLARAAEHLAQCGAELRGVLTRRNMMLE
jgi:hypothetical protein